MQALLSQLRPSEACPCQSLPLPCRVLLALFSRPGLEEFQSVARDLFSPRAHARVCGYETFWMAEHHFQTEGTELIPNLLMMAMHLCGVTENRKIGCGFNIVPMWHPLRLAEDYAGPGHTSASPVVVSSRST